MPYDLKCVNPMTQSFGFIERSDLTKRDSACYGNCQVRNYECNTCVFPKLIILEAFKWSPLTKMTSNQQKITLQTSKFNINKAIKWTMIKIVNLQTNPRQHKWCLMNAAPTTFIIHLNLLIWQNKLPKFPEINFIRGLLFSLCQITKRKASQKLTW